MYNVTSILCMNVGMLAYYVFVDYSRKGDLGALDKNDSTPIRTAVVYKNDVAFDAMVEKGGDFLSSTLFEAAKKPDTSNIQALEVPFWNYVICRYFAAYLSSTSFSPTITITNVHKWISKVCGFSVCYHSRDGHNNTPVHTTACYGNLTAFQVFLDWQHRDQWEEKVELICNNEGRTPAHLALEFDHFR